MLAGGHITSEESSEVIHCFHGQYFSLNRLHRRREWPAPYHILMLGSGGAQICDRFSYIWAMTIPQNYNLGSSVLGCSSVVKGTKCVSFSFKWCDVTDYRVMHPMHIRYFYSQYFTFYLEHSDAWAQQVVHNFSLLLCSTLIIWPCFLWIDINLMLENDNATVIQISVPLT